MSRPNISIFEEAVSLKAIVQVAADYAERNAILVALARNHWVKKRTAKFLSINVVTLEYKIKYHGLERSSEPNDAEEAPAEPIR